MFERARPLLALLLPAFITGPALAQTIESQQHDFVLETVVEGLDKPWGMAFLPNGDILVTEKSGTLRLIQDGTLLDQTISGIPDVKDGGQGGLLDVAVDPDFETNNLIYMSYAAGGLLTSGTTVARGRLDGMSLQDVEVIFEADPRSRGGRHFGSRLLFDDQRHLFITTGDRGERERAQDLDDHRGSMIRIFPDGSIPGDNPFVNIEGALPEIYSYGHRNIQGISRDPETGTIWAHEHGPRGGDEVNVIEPGLNYGWPIITYGEEYSGGNIGIGFESEGLVQPKTYWVPSIAPSGMIFYTGDAFPEWQGDIFVGALAGSLIARLELDGQSVTEEERLLEDYGRRIRDLEVGPDGYVYVLVDESPAPLLRMVPAS